MKLSLSLLMGLLKKPPFCICGEHFNHSDVTQTPWGKWRFPQEPKVSICSQHYLIVISPRTILIISIWAKSGLWFVVEKWLIIGRTKNFNYRLCWPASRFLYFLFFTAFLRALPSPYSNSEVSTYFTKVGLWNHSEWNKFGSG